MNISDFKKRKQSGPKLAMVTCYDYWTAQILNTSNIDALLVGDSAAMVMHGHTSTLPISIDTMALHVQAVVRGAGDKFVVADMPFLSFRKSLDSNMLAVEKLMQAGAHAVKLEGAAGNLELVRHIVESGVPVMGHLGLTPQSVNQLGGFRVQGRQKTESEKIIEAARHLEDAGCFSVVLECVPASLAAVVTAQLSIPTIGIGAGAATDGQILVLQDLLGMNSGFKPKFLRTYLKGFEVLQNAVNHYVDDVQNQRFPSVEESYE